MRTIRVQPVGKTPAQWAIQSLVSHGSVHETDKDLVVMAQDPFGPKETWLIKAMEAVGAFSRVLVAEEA